uniref:Uncharacterized protein n=1 Tax=Otus sunia TaxID=257818 RepID=A0A8C8AHW0_9STRI
MGTVPQRLQRLLDRPGPLGDLLGRLEARTGVRRLYLATGATGAPGTPPPHRASGLCGGAGDWDRAGRE